MSVDDVGVITDIGDQSTYCTPKYLENLVRGEYGIHFSEDTIMDYIIDSTYHNKIKDQHFLELLHIHNNELTAKNIYKHNGEYSILFNTDYVEANLAVIVGFLFEFLLKTKCSLEEKVGSVHIQTKDDTPIRLQVSLMQPLLDDLIDIHTAAQQEVFHDTTKMLRKYIYTFSGMIDDITGKVRKDIRGF